MKKIRLAKSAYAFDKLEKWHRVFEGKLPFAYEKRYVPTNIGETEVLVTGPKQGTPIVLLHGAMSGAPFALGELGDIPEKHPCFAINIPGQSTRSPQVLLDFDGREYGVWLEQVFNALGISNPILAGVSYGGSIALQYAVYAPKALAGLLLIVPGSIVRGPFWESMWKITLPLIRYQLKPTPKNRDRFFASMLTTPDIFWSPYLHDAIHGFNRSYKIPPLLRKRHFSQLQAPVYLIAADRDIYFPGPKMIQRAKTIFPNLVGSHLLQDTKHCPSFRLEDRAAFARIFQVALEELGISKSQGHAYSPTN